MERERATYCAVGLFVVDDACNGVQRQPLVHLLCGVFKGPGSRGGVEGKEGRGWRVEEAGGRELRGGG